MGDWDPEVLTPPQPTEIWNPVLKKNVNLSTLPAYPAPPPRGGGGDSAGDSGSYSSGMMSPAQYIAANPGAYQNYTGAVQHIGNQPIHVNTYVPSMGAQPAPTSQGFDPVALQRAQEQAALNPYSVSPTGEMTTPMGTQGGTDALSQILKSWQENVRRIPGGNPTYGVLPGSSLYYNLQTAQQEDPKKLDALTRLYGGFTQRSPGKIPTLAQSGGPGGISGRGYALKGLSPQQRQMADAAVAGDRRAAVALSRTLGRNWSANPLSGMQQFAKKYYGPALAAAVGGIASGGVGAALGPAWGAGVGAGFGALSQGAQTRWRDPAAVGIGTAAGALGGYGAGAGAQAAGLGPVASNALAGAGGSISRNVAGQAYRGALDPAQIAREAAISGAVSGGVAGLQGLGRGGYVNTPGEPGGGFAVPPRVNPVLARYGSPVVGSAAGSTLDYYLPGGREAPNPYAAQQRAAEEARRRRAFATAPRSDR